ncbi:MAG: saccharopine dehydrogenase [Burkholderiales bacterium RIFCSPLOWO2_12_FULL_61_40]|nr:MAG: saccharopine dehydrogenase [Burkholderiales bacterium RIFCSPLOWO2_12_FULL_61_40]
MKTLVLGGYGNFGARICRALSTDPTLQLLVGGRDRKRANALAAELGHGAQGVAIDHSAPDLAQTLRQLGVGLLIHTAGPFQQQNYGVAEAAAAAGAHYIDLADGRRFVCDFSPALHATFAAADRCAISGASTVPALSSAVVEHLCAGWQRVDSIDTCIAPAQTAPRGKATLAAVLNYCGEALQVWHEGRWQAQRGWASPQRVHFARLRPRLGALCDIPDLELFPTRYAVHQRVMFRAALEVGFAQRAFAVLAALRSWGVMARPARLAGLLNTSARALDFLGTPLGGMVLRVEGLDGAGRAARRAWHIAADHDHGPEIPCMAAVLLARRLARGAPLPVGASACMGLLTLADFEPEFARWGMVTDVVNDALPDAPNNSASAAPGTST